MFYQDATLRYPQVTLANAVPMTKIVTSALFGVRKLSTISHGLRFLPENAVFRLAWRLLLLPRRLLSESWTDTEAPVG